MVGWCCNSHRYSTRNMAEHVESVFGDFLAKKVGRGDNSVKSGAKRYVTWYRVGL